MDNLEEIIRRNFQETMDLQKKALEGFSNILEMEPEKPGVSEKDLVYKEDKMRLFHYKPLKKRELKSPVLIVYALVNRETMMDLEMENSFIRELLKEGIDVYIIDWGYPTIDDKYLSMEDYIDGYINNSVDFILGQEAIDRLNILGVCQGGTFSAIYSSLYPEKVKNLITMVTPIDFEPNDALLFAWGKYLNIDRLVDGYYGLVPGNILNNSFVTLKPMALMVNKYLDFIDDFNDPKAVKDFFRMEDWIFDSPDQAGQALKEFINDLYRDNKLVKGEFILGEKPVDLKKLTMPILNIYGKYDHIVSPESSQGLDKYVGSKDVETHEIPTGHIGMYVSGKSKKLVSPLVVKWLKDRD